jgi:hypothetical protein
MSAKRFGAMFAILGAGILLAEWSAPVGVAFACWCADELGELWPVRRP